MALLEHELAQARFQYNLVLTAILEAAERDPSSSCILFRGDFLVFTASVFWPFPLLLAGCCLFLSQFLSSPSPFLTNFGILFIKYVKSEPCGYNLVYILAEISGRVTAEFRPSIGPCPLTSVSHRYYNFQGFVPHRPELGRSSAGCPFKKTLSSGYLIGPFHQGLFLSNRPDMYQIIPDDLFF